MAFMEPEITDQEEWYEVEGNACTEWVQVSLVGHFWPFPHVKEVDFEHGRNNLPGELKDYCENKDVYAIRLIEGYGARMQAPGYMDATEWCVFESEAEAAAYLEEHYTDDEEDETD